jgi:CheY-like chemotaxis protein
MIHQSLRTPRILIVEDDEELGEDIKSVLDRTPDDVLRELGIRRFEIETATSESEAARKLGEASSAPYHLMLLDLKLPRNKGDEIEDMEGGFRVLKSAQKSQIVKAFIVISAHSLPENIYNAFRGGALDFITKPLPPSDLRTRIFQSWRRILEKESVAILDQRIKEMTHYTAKGLAHSFTKVFSALVQTTANVADKIETYASERYGLDPDRDKQDALMRYLLIQREAINNGRQDWAKLQESLSRDVEKPDTLSVEACLSDLNEILLPCLKVKNVELGLPQSGDTRVITFQQDVQAVLKEIIVGALSELPDHGDLKTITIEINAAGSRAEARFSDNLGLMKGVDAINTGHSIIPDPKFGRMWGLSVVQHVALRSGGELFVESQTDGNVITYHIPLAHHA